MLANDVSGDLPAGNTVHRVGVRLRDQIEARRTEISEYIGRKRRGSVRDSGVTAHDAGVDGCAVRKIVHVHVAPQFEC